jgi:hypothetical protein
MTEIIKLGDPAKGRRLLARHVITAALSVMQQRRACHAAIAASEAIDIAA